MFEAITSTSRLQQAQQSSWIPCQWSQGETAPAAHWPQATTRLLGWSSVEPLKCTGCRYQYLCNNSTVWPLLLHATAPHWGWYKHSQRWWTVKAQKGTGLPKRDSGINLWILKNLGDLESSPLGCLLIMNSLGTTPLMPLLLTLLQISVWWPVTTNPTSRSLLCQQLAANSSLKEGAHDSGHIPEATL